MSIDTISFSALQDLDRCPHLFKIRRIDHVYIQDSTIETIFGKLIHRCCQNILLDTLTIASVCETMEYFQKIWDRFIRLYKKYLNASKTLYLKDCGLNILENLKRTVDSYFKSGYTVFSVEEQIKLKALEKYPQNFKAYIDIVFKIGDQYVISDFKTCSSIYFFEKYLNKEKERQLVFYKYYFAKKYSIDIKNIKINFILLEKNPNSENPVKVKEITSGDRKIQNHLTYLDRSLNIIQDPGIYPKNRLGCTMYNGQCNFYRTKYCS